MEGLVKTVESVKLVDLVSDIWLLLKEGGLPLLN